MLDGEDSDDEDYGGFVNPRPPPKKVADSRDVLREKEFKQKEADLKDAVDIAWKNYMKTKLEKIRDAENKRVLGSLTDALADRRRSAAHHQNLSDFYAVRLKEHTDSPHINTLTKIEFERTLRKHSMEIRDFQSAQSDEAKLEELLRQTEARHVISLKERGITEEAIKKEKAEALEIHQQLFKQLKKLQEEEENRKDTIRRSEWAEELKKKEREDLEKVYNLLSGDWNRQRSLLPNSIEIGDDS